MRLTELEFAELLSRRSMQKRPRNPIGPVRREATQKVDRTVSSVDFLVAGLKTVSEANGREHWAVRNRRKKDQQLETLLALNNNLRGRSVKLPCVVKLSRIGPKALDDDNLANGFKAIRDTVAGRLGCDDGDTKKISFQYSQEPIRVREYGVRITITSQQLTPE